MIRFFIATQASYKLFLSLIQRDGILNLLCFHLSRPVLFAKYLWNYFAYLLSLCCLTISISNNRRHDLRHKKHLMVTSQTSLIYSFIQSCRVAIYHLFFAVTLSLKKVHCHFYSGLRHQSSRNTHTISRVFLIRYHFAFIKLVIF